MLTWLRDNAKIFLIVTIVIFVGLIFLRWGMGEGSGMPRNPYQRPVARVDGKEIMPSDYQDAIQSMSQNYRNMLESMNHPDPEAMMMLMSSRLSEQAFEELINGHLQSSFLRKRDWSQFTLEQAEELLIAQIGMQDLGDMTAREYLETIRSEQPGTYQQYLYQTYMTGNSMLFPMAASMMNMASLEEVRYLERESRAEITARYITVEADTSLPGEEYLRDFYREETDNFARPAGSLLRYITFGVQPQESDVQNALNRLDSLTFSTRGTQVASTQAQLAAAFGDTIQLEEGRRTEPFTGMYSANPSINAFHVLLLDSVHQFSDTLAEGEDPALHDTLFLRSWETPIFPGYSTVRRMKWDIESEIETMLAERIPNIPDSLVILDFGEMMVDEDTPMSGTVSEEMAVFATDTIWRDSIGPVFYDPSYRGGYPALTVVRRLAYHPSDTLSYEEALETGVLRETALYHLRREASLGRAQEMLEDIRGSGVNLGTFADVESLQVRTTPVFTAAEVKAASQTDPMAEEGILASDDFAMAVITAPEFQVIGPFLTGTECVLAEILSRQEPSEDQNTQTVTYLSTQYGHQQLAMERILENLRETSDIRDLREEWTSYLETVEDSLRAEEEQLEE
ncbi:MAG: SurA N-terminal domain-containing protein [Candidatus Aegiribacteria sp.]